jgi:putative sigma-54 modulation protein
VVKTVRLPIETMTLEQASLALEDAKNEFFVFLNSKSQQVNVLYRRQDENFGLIVPEL